MEAQKTKQKIEDIFPLNTMQESLLFHSLSSNEDMGLLFVQLNIYGDLNTEVLKRSWDKVVKRHQTLRSSIHWKKVKQPIQLVQPEAVASWEILDWSSLSTIEFEQKLTTFKEEKTKEGITLDKSPLGQLYLVNKEKNHYIFLWKCHHIFLDGWSTSIVINDLFENYKAISGNTSPKFSTVPSYKSYLTALKQIDKKSEVSYWKDRFEGFNTPILFGKTHSSFKPVTKKLNFNLTDSDALTAYAKNNQITLNTLFQGIWHLVLCKYFNTNDTAFGITVSGRSLDFPNIDLMAGMFSTNLPTRYSFEPKEKFSSELQKIQNLHNEGKVFENIGMVDIQKHLPDTDFNALFDSLFIFENFPWSKIEVAGITVDNFVSGITTTQEVTLIVKSHPNITFWLIVNGETIPIQISDWIMESIRDLFHHILEKPKTTVRSLLENLNPSPEVQTKILAEKKSVNNNVHPPTNALEKQLVDIWESVLKVDPIGIHDNFFELGGKSLQSLSIFNTINEKLGIDKNPILLLSHPTISALASVLVTNEGEKIFKHLVPLKSEGNKSPLFCIHAGGGHVFFYKPLGKVLDENRPLYGLHAGMDNPKALHNNIEEMTADYIREMRKIQPNGILNVLVYCFSTAIGVEIAHKLNQSNDTLNLVVADTVAKEYDKFERDYLKIRAEVFFKNLIKNPLKTINRASAHRIEEGDEAKRRRIIDKQRDENINAVREQLIVAHNDYEWKKVDANLLLLITKDKNETRKKLVINSWKKLIKREIKITEIPNNHYVIFEESNIENVGIAIEDFLSKVANEK